MTASSTYVLDSDVFIAAKNAYYAFDICPGFWAGLLRGYQVGRVSSIDRVKGELLAGRPDEDLVQWVRKDVPGDFFRDCNDPSVIEAYSDIMLWVQRNPQYFDRAKAKFATEADGWLAAYSMVHGTVIVTNEQPRPEARNRILLPDVCVQFKVPYKDTFLMLRELGLRFNLAEAT